MQHIRNIGTEQSKRDARWNSARTLAGCNAYMAIEAQRCGALGFASMHDPKHAIRGPSFIRGYRSTVEGHYRYAREIMGVTEKDQFYA